MKEKKYIYITGQLGKLYAERKTGKLHPVLLILVVIVAFPKLNERCMMLISQKSSFKLKVNCGKSFCKTNDC